MRVGVHRLHDGRRAGGVGKWKQAAQLNAEKLVEVTKPKIDTRDLGDRVETTSIDPMTGKATVTGTSTKGQSPDNAASTAASRYATDSSAATAGARLKFDKDKEEGAGVGDLSDATVDAIGQGRMKAPTGYALRNPKMANLMDRVAAKYPEYDATEYDAKQKAMRDFSTGTPGNSIRSFAVAVDHLTQLDHLIDALDNGNTPLINRIGNKVAQATGSVAPTNFDAAKGIVAKEVLKSIVAGGGVVEERPELAHLLDNAKPTQQLKGVVGTYLHLIGVQKTQLEKEYALSTGRKDAITRFGYSSEEPTPRPRRRRRQQWT